MKVIGTAGHIDHGKSTLVRRLTGIDPDRLAEEKRRGMTIDLGFAWLTLPSGVDVSIVDVPGHERFVKNMLAGVGGIDVALLVVAADEAVMPQTREHLAILDLLNVRFGVVALTKVDLVDGEWLELAMADVSDVLSGTTLEHSPIVPVSAVSGQGIQSLLEQLDLAIASTPEPADTGLPYIPIDRVFSVSGFGTVVTGTLHGGHLSAGDELETSGSGRMARVRGLQTHRREVTAAGPGSRVALNLAGPAREELRRGDVLALPGTVSLVHRLDARLRLLADAPFPLHHGTELMFHIGAAEATAMVSVLGEERIEPGETGWVQIRFAEPTPVVPGQRFIVRLPAPARTIGGGQVVDVTPRHRRFDVKALDRLSAMSSASLEDAVLATLPADRPRVVSRMAATLGVTSATIAPLLERMAGEGRAVRIGDAFISVAGWETFARKVSDALAAYHRAHRLKQGMPKEELRRKMGWPQTLWPSTLRALAEREVLLEHGALVADPAHRGGTAGRRDETERVLAVLRREPFTPPSGPELLTLAGTDPDLLAAMVEEGSIVRLAEGLFLAREAYDRLVALTLAAIARDGQITVAGLRDAAGTSRKYALAFLEHLDAERITRRVGDARVLGGRAPACA